MTINSIQNILQTLYQGYTLNQTQSAVLMHNIIHQKLSETEIATALISMKIRGERFDEIVGSAKTLLNHAKFFPRPHDLFADISGTGGDGKNTINISTISAIVASTCNVKIIKHGNCKISSLLGSTNILARYNLNVETDAYKNRKIFDTLGICFLHAPQYYEVFRYIMPIRKKIQVPTLFNILGPLINPSKPPLALIGVYKKELLLPMLQTLKILKYQRAITVHCDGIDEVGLHAPTQVAELNNGNIDHYILTAGDFGLHPQPIEKLYCHSIEQSCNSMTQLLQGKGEPAHEYVISANVALLLKLFGYNNLSENTSLILDKIRQGIPHTHLLSLLNYKI